MENLLFFNTHVKKGKEIGTAVRGILSTACIGTGYFDPVAPKQLPSNFFEDNYVRAFTTVTCALLMKYQMGGMNWSTEKSGECIAEALHFIDPTDELWRLHLDTTPEVVEQPDFVSGREAATTLYGVIHGKLRLDDPDPVLAEAKKIVAESNGRVDLVFAVTKLTIINHIQAKYRELDEFEEDCSSSMQDAASAGDSNVLLEENNATLRVCPFCAEDIKAKAIKCKHCGEWLEKR